MSKPNVPDFVIIQVMTTGQTPTAVTLCGLNSAGINRTVTTNDRFIPDCEKPGEVPSNEPYAVNRSWTVTGSGFVNMDMIDEYEAALGIRRTYRVLYGKRDGTEDGSVFGYYNGQGIMESLNDALGEESTSEITIKGAGWPVWTDGDPR